MELSKERILSLFQKLDARLQSQHLIGEIGVVEGAALCLIFDQRSCTKDVDAIFLSTSKIRQFVEEIGDEENLPRDWLNNAAKGYLALHSPQKEVISEGRSLKVWVPQLEYLFAMKALASRVDTKDQADVRFLIQKIPIPSFEKAIEIVHHYYPKGRISQKTYYFLEEIFQLRC